MKTMNIDEGLVNFLSKHA